MDRDEPVRRPARSALERAAQLLDRSVDELDVSSGYVDLLGADSGSPRSTGFAQRLMVTRVVPAIYERWWRPALGRLAKGLSGPSMEEEYRLAAELLRLSPGNAVIDVACGPGNFTRRFAQAVGGSGLALGLDVSTTMLARAVRSTEEQNVVYVRGDATDVPVRPGSIDGVCCFAALHLFPEPAAAVGSMIRSLVPGGRLALLTSHRPRGVLGATVAAAGTAAGMRVFTSEELEAIIEESGAQVTSQRTDGLLQIVGARVPA